jgi:hypothetical protein
LKARSAGRLGGRERVGKTGNAGESGNWVKSVTLGEKKPFAACVRAWAVRYVRNVGV